MRRIVTTYTKTPQEVAEKMTLPTWSSEVNADGMKTLADLSVKYGILKDDIDLDPFINFS